MGLVLFLQQDEKPNSCDIHYLCFKNGLVLGLPYFYCRLFFATGRELRHFLCAFIVVYRF